MITIGISIPILAAGSSEAVADKAWDPLVRIRSGDFFRLSFWRLAILVCSTWVRLPTGRAIKGTGASIHGRTRSSSLTLLIILSKAATIRGSSEAAQFISLYDRYRFLALALCAAYTLLVSPFVSGFIFASSSSLCIGSGVLHCCFISWAKAFFWVLRYYCVVSELWLYSVNCRICWDRCV